MHEPDPFIPHDLDLIDQPKPTELVSELLLRHVLVQTSKVHVPTRVALSDRKRNLRGHRARFPPADFQLLAVQGELLDGGVCVEEGGGVAVEEGEEDAGLFREDADRFEGTKVDEVEQLVYGGGGREVADVHRASDSVVCGACSEGHGGAQRGG